MHPETFNVGQKVCTTINELYHAEDAWNAIEFQMANPAVEAQPCPGPHTVSQ